MCILITCVTFRSVSCATFDSSTSSSILMHCVILVVLLCAVVMMFSVRLVIVSPVGVPSRTVLIMLSIAGRDNHVKYCW